MKSSLYFLFFVFSLFPYGFSALAALQESSNIHSFCYYWLHIVLASRLSVFTAKILDKVLLNIKDDPILALFFRTMLNNHWRLAFPCAITTTETAAWVIILKWLMNNLKLVWLKNKALLRKRSENHAFKLVKCFSLQYSLRK